MEVILRRHAMTAGNSKKQYIGSTDQPLSPEGEQSARLCAGTGDETVSKVFQPYAPLSFDQPDFLSQGPGGNLPPSAGDGFRPV